MKENITKAEKFSYSRLETYDNCGYKYNLRYNKKIYVNTDSVASAFGSLLHKINEIQTNTILAGEKIDYDMLKDYFRSVNLPKKNKYDREGDMFGYEILAEKYAPDWFKEDKNGNTYQDKAERFLQSGIYRQENYLAEHPELELYAAELPFEYERHGYIFRGYIDRVLVYKNNPRHYVIHDLKTSANAYDDKKCVTPLQFVIYCKALRQMFGEDIIIDCFYEFPVAEAMKAAGTKGFEDRGMKKIDKLLAGIEGGDFAPNPSALCYWCEYCNNNPNCPDDGRNMCPYYSMWKPDAKSFAVNMPWLGPDLDDLQVHKFQAIEQLKKDDDFDIEI